jgi:amino acid transporter
VATVPTEQSIPPPEDSGTLQRSLGLLSIVMISIGAMVGASIFVLPGLAFKLAGPAVIAAFFLAGVVVFPAALSKAEMATAMPQAGGTYLYIDRAMGPLMGTIAGFGVWFSLVFKAAFALVGLSAYLEYFFHHEERLVAAGIALALIGLNLIGIHSTAQFQIVLVSIVVFILFGFIVFGSIELDSARFEPFMPHGITGLLSATGLVFVSYAGITKVASVAEEVRRPERNLPFGMLFPVGFMMLLYPAIVAVIVGVTPAAELAASESPMATAAENFLGDIGVKVIAGAAVVALISLANAGVIGSTRYPFAMARNSLAPPFLARVGDRSHAPYNAILVTGGVLLALVLFVPLLDLAKLASAFQLLVFAFINVALVAFREAKLDWYQPEFRSPWYPVPQIFGIVATIVLLSFMGLVPTIGAAVIIAGGVVWYRIFGGSRAVKESAARDALRARADDRLVEATADQVGSAGRDRVVILLQRPTRPERQQTLFRLARELTASPGGHIHVINFDTTTRWQVPATQDRAEAERLGVEVTVAHYTDEDRRGAVHLYVENEGVDLFITDLPQELRATRTVTRDLAWLREQLPCDSVFLRNRAVDSIDSISVLGTGGPYDPVKIGIADHIARNEGAAIRFVHLVSPDAPPAQAAAIHEYHERLGAVLTVPWDDQVRPAQDLVGTLTELSRGANLVILGAPGHRFTRVTDLADRIAEAVDCPALLVHMPRLENANLASQAVQWFIS